MSVSTHVGTHKAPPKINLKGSAKGAAAAKVAAQREANKAERIHTRQTVTRRSTRLGDLSGRELGTQNLTQMCQVAIVRSGKSFTKIGEEQGLNPQTVSRLLYGKTKRVSAETMLAVLGAGGVTLEMREAH